ncbi:PREDICTED: uncharacterized protein LOC108559153 [Nicrophorus vespilloides]|uniref:Uncharacterized protein LOC108559153 n=1 Tax=Nicrophorus vespilloides TaxID=110193 RepID=A0ABM1MB51_NICVS|nr:PREDICTED: uncharacterized protein LOC108559153 [Nicrophorus vespilloides]
MDMSHSFWEDNSTIQNVKYESCNSNDEPAARVNCFDGTSLNFSTGEEDCTEYTGAYRKTPNVRVSRQDPMSHRIIEKRRRDRMNNCLADLSRLIPAEYLKKGRGRVEKTEIIEMAIKHMKHLQYLNHYRLGYQECMSETMRFMVEVEGRFPREPFCVRLLGHLQQHRDSICRGTPEKAIQQVPVPLPAKIEPNNNLYEDIHESGSHEKNGYKYKNDIKLRFNQDLNIAKRSKIDEDSRRDSSTSIENHSHTSSPHQSEICTRVSSSETETHQASSTSPTGSSASQTTKSSHVDLKTNFSVPVFVLHAKGSFYVPITLDYQTLSPYLGSYDLLNLANDIVLHPVAINVNFQPSFQHTQNLK